MLQTASEQPPAHGVVQAWDRLAERFSFLLIVGVWFVVAVPTALYRGYHYVEGVTVQVAKGALENGHWLTPYMFNQRWVERPTLLSWLIAGISTPFGEITPFLARLPTILCLLAGALLIWRALRPAASAGAALTGALLFLASPVVIRYYATAVADIPLAVVLFGAFLVWWNAYARGRISYPRWFSIGCLLAIAALLKGPQPVAYFLLGLGVFTLISSSWWQIPGLALAGTVALIPVALWYAHVFVPGDQGEWMRYTRLSSSGATHPHPLNNAVKFIFEVFPATLFAAALLVTPKNSVKTTVPPNFVLALTCYAFTCTVVILFWPAGVTPRYVLPMVLPICVLAGLGYDALNARWPAFVIGGLCATLGLLGYATMHSAVDTFAKPAYIRTKLDGDQMTELVRKMPAPLYRTSWLAGMNELLYVPYWVDTIDPAAIASVAKPAWILVPTEDADAMIAKSNGRLKSSLALERAVLLRSE